MDNKDRSRPAVLDALMEALRAEIDAEMKRRRIGLGDIRRAMDWSATRKDHFSASLRSDVEAFGYVAALGVAAKLRIPVRIEVGVRRWRHEARPRLGDGPAQGVVDPYNAACRRARTTAG
ncbi:hypothetical protein [uncultured Aureimonas sp.]|uniref:hypothetical protein n=1 Tax=uncultured Aureimonas sp. TaxID=1604662 RepID=UPI0025E6A3C9|nr:hypothetical protein [uncultured Aureimonas sp.]